MVVKVGGTTLTSSCVRMCVSACVRMCARTHMYLCAHVGRGQGSTLGLILFALSTLSFRDRVSSLKFTKA